MLEAYESTRQMKMGISIFYLNSCCCFYKKTLVLSTLFYINIVFFKFSVSMLTKQLIDGFTICLAKQSMWRQSYSSRVYCTKYYETVAKVIYLCFIVITQVTYLTLKEGGGTNHGNNSYRCEELINKYLIIIGIRCIFQISQISILSFHFHF